jgi:ArsR family transcriptional regulator
MHKALSHPVRLRIVELLADKVAFGIADEECCAAAEVCVCRMNDLFDLSSPALSHHLAILRRIGLVTTRRDGVRIYYRLRPDVLRQLAERLLILAEKAPGD